MDLVGRAEGGGDGTGAAAPSEDVLRRLATGLSRGAEYVLMLCDLNFDIEYVSPAVTMASGWEPSQLIGRNVLEHIHPDDLETAARLLAAEQRRPLPYGADVVRRTADRLRVLGADGSWIGCEYAASNLGDDPEVRGNVFILRDVTEQLLKDQVHDAIVSGGPLDETARRIARLLSGQLEGLAVHVHAPTAGAAGHVTVGHTDAPVHEVEVVTAAGGRIVAEHPGDREPSEWVHVLVERSAKLLDAAIVRDQHDRAMRRRLDEKTALISAVSHDLRSPLAAIQLMSNLLDGDGDHLSDDQRRQLVARINADARRTSRLLTDLTAADRILHGVVELRPQPLDVGAMCERVAADVDLDGRVCTVAPRPAPAVAAADPVLTERIVDNLLANAAKHTPSTARIEVCVEVADGQVLLHVDDDGPGVPAESRTRIFEAYVRGDDAATGPAGSGMGLFLVRTFAEVQGGAVGCSESPSGGARFTVRLPAAALHTTG